MVGHDMGDDFGLDLDLPGLPETPADQKESQRSAVEEVVQAEAVQKKQKRRKRKAALINRDERTELSSKYSLLLLLFFSLFCLNISRILRLRAFRIPSSFFFSRAPTCLKRTPEKTKIALRRIPDFFHTSPRKKKCCLAIEKVQRSSKIKG